MGCQIFQAQALSKRMLEMNSPMHGHANALEPRMDTILSPSFTTMNF